MRWWDFAAASRPDYYISASKTVAERVKLYYGRESEVIYPPVDNLQFTRLRPSTSLRTPASPAKRGESARQAISNFYLIVSRLVPYKKVDVAIKVFNELKLPLVIVGTGSEERKLREMAGETIYFTRQLTDSELIWYYSNCLAFIMPQEEDFGIAAVEAQSFGKPVIAFGRGGAKETVINNITGVLFQEQSVESLIEALKRFKNYELRIKNETLIKKNAERFNKERFKEEFKKYYENCCFLRRNRNKALAVV